MQQQQQQEEQHYFKQERNENKNKIHYSQLKVNIPSSSHCNFDPINKTQIYNQHNNYNPSHD